jgi:CheY-like chemotaxis protein
MSSGFQAHVTKPVMAAELLAAIAHFAHDPASTGSAPR